MPSSQSTPSPLPFFTSLQLLSLPLSPLPCLLPGAHCPMSGGSWGTSSPKPWFSFPSLYHSDTDLSVGPPGGPSEDGGLPQPSPDDGGFKSRLESSIPNLDSAKDSDVTQETDSSDSEDQDWSPRVSPLERTEMVDDLRDQLYQGQKIVDMVLKQKRQLRAMILENVEGVLDTIAGDPYLLHQTRNYLDDLIIGFRGLASLDQTPGSLWFIL